MMQNDNYRDGLGKSYQIPDASDLLEVKNNMFVIVGAGPTGLTTALTLYHEGYRDIVILEKRSDFTRMNIVNFHRETLTIIKKLGIVESFSKAASKILGHTDFIFHNTDEKIKLEDTNTQEMYENVNEKQTFEPEEMPHLYNGDSIYSISLMDLQRYLATLVLDLGIPILPHTYSRVFLIGDNRYAIEFQRESDRQPCMIDRPKLIVLANGSNSDLFRSLGGHYIGNQRPESDEHWLFGNYEFSTPECFVNSMVELEETEGNYKISNYIFVSKTQEVNVATRVRPEELSNTTAEMILFKQAKKIRSLMHLSPEIGQLTWITRDPVNTGPKQASQLSFGDNLVVIGDAAGTCSPISGLGCTMGISAHQYAIGNLVKDLDTQNTKSAFAKYCQRIESYVKKWNANTCKNYQKIKDRIDSTYAIR